MVEGKLTGVTLCWDERAEVHDEVLFLVNWKDLICNIEKLV